MAAPGLTKAGFVLDAFPIAIDALELWRKAAELVGLFLQIKLVYKRWCDDLNFHKLLFEGNLRQLLLPLVLDDDTIEELFLAPGGDCWREERVTRLFEARLGDSYGLYMQYIDGMKQTMDEIKRALAVDPSLAQKLKHNQSQASSSEENVKDFITRQLYKFKLIINETTRERLFGELQQYNDRLERLLRASDEDIRLQRDRKSKGQLNGIDLGVCNIWRQAKNVFQALAFAWTCQCQQHGAKLLLQHRTTPRTEFEITFSGFSTSEFESHKVKILEAEDTVLKQSRSTLDRVPTSLHQPSHRWSHRLVSGLRTKIKKKIPPSQLQDLSYLLRRAHVDTGPSFPIADKIVNLCSALGMPEASYYGYLVQEECHYHVYNISRQNNQAVRSATLDQMLRGSVSPPLTRSQRYNLSLILASTFLQLLDSPWLSVCPERSDIIFLGSHSEDARTLRLDQPYINHNFRPLSTHNTMHSTEKTFSFFDALDHLGIMLLELCFGRVIEDQPCRKKLRVGDTDQEKKGFDMLAAREWQCDVNGEAGGDYAEAVSWCLGGNRITPPERWRQEMLRRVIHPLHRCHEYLSNTGVDR